MGGEVVAVLPDFCAGLVPRIHGSRLLPCTVDQLTVNEYQPGIGISSHVDAHSAFEDGIAAVTLGAGVVMEFRKPVPNESGKVTMGKHHRMAPPPPETLQQVQKNVWLPPNSLLVIKGEARYAWTHGIAWRKTDCLTPEKILPRGRRASLTFRAAKRSGPCCCAWPDLCDGQNPEVHALPTRISA